MRIPQRQLVLLQSWWTDKPVLHLLPHWNWSGKEGQQIRVWAHSNCDEVELLLNDESLGRKKVERNSHVEWEVFYRAGSLLRAVSTQVRKRLPTRLRRPANRSPSSSRRIVAICTRTARMSQ